MIGPEEAEGLPEAPPEAHAKFWSMGELNKTLFVVDVDAVALLASITTAKGANPMPVVVMRFGGKRTGDDGTVEEQVLTLPVDVAQETTALLIEQLAKIEHSPLHRIHGGPGAPEG